jgi:hypothetical protein
MTEANDIVAEISEHAHSAPVAVLAALLRALIAQKETADV